MLRLPRLLLLSSASCKWSYRRALLLQMIIRSGQPFANYYLEWPASCKWSLLSPLFSRKFSPAQFLPHTKCQLLNGRFLKLSSPLLGSTCSTLLHRPRIMSGQIHVARVYLKVDRENKQRGLFRTRIGTSCFLFKFKECALCLAWHLSHHGIWQNIRLFLR